MSSFVCASFSSECFIYRWQSSCFVAVRVNLEVSWQVCLSINFIWSRVTWNKYTYYALAILWLLKYILRRNLFNLNGTKYIRMTLSYTMPIAWGFARMNFGFSNQISGKLRPRLVTALPTKTDRQRISVPTWRCIETVSVTYSFLPDQLW